MAKSEGATPKAIFDQFANLSEDEQVAFLRLFGEYVTVDVLFFLLNSLTAPEHQRFMDMTGDKLLELVVPLMLQHARQVAKEMPDISDEEFDQEVNSRVAQSTDQFQKHVGELEAVKLKANRDRKSDPETVRRNIEICDRRKQDPKKWTEGRLARDYDVTDAYIRKVLRQEDHWRRLAASLPK